MEWIYIRLYGVYNGLASKVFCRYVHGDFPILSVGSWNLKIIVRLGKLGYVFIRGSGLWAIILRGRARPFRDLLFIYWASLIANTLKKHTSLELLS